MGDSPTTGQAARAPGVSHTTVRHMIKNGEQHSARVTRGRHAQSGIAGVERGADPTRYARATARAAAKLTSRLDLEHVLHTVVETLVDDFDAALARVWLCDGATDTLRLRASAGSAHAPTLSAYLRADTITGAISLGEVVRPREPFVNNDLAADPQFDREWAAREGITALAVVPLVIGAELRGMLAHFARKPIPEEIVESLASLAVIVTASLRDIDLFAREQALRAAAEASAAEASAQTRRLALVQQTAREMAVTTSVQELCDRLVAAIHARMGRHVVGVFVRDGDELRLAAHRVPADVGAREATRLPLGVGIVGHVGATNQPYLCRDTHADPHYHRLLDVDTRAEVAVPICAGGDLIGVLNVESPHPNAFDDDDLATLAAIADQAAIAIENARLYEIEADLRRRAETRAHRIEHVQRVGEWLKMGLDEQEIGARVVEAACEALGFRGAVLNLVDRPGAPVARARVVATAGLPPEGREALMAHDYPLSDVEALFQRQFLLSRSYFIPQGAAHIASTTEIPTWTPAIANEGPNAWRAGDELLVPLTDSQGGHLLGFLSVDDPESGRRPEREEVEVLEIFADKAVVALRNAHLLAEARRLAECDPLTNLLNHRAVHARLEVEFAAAAAAGRPLGVLVLDMDDFKLINDTHGHPAGDMALRHIAGLLGRCARSTDVAARLGGDEFLLLLPGATRAQSVEIAQRLNALADETPLCIEGIDPLPLRLSVGVAAYPDDANHPHVLVALADARLYEAKRAGGRTVEAGRDTHDNGWRGPGAELAGFDILSGLVTAVDNKDRYTREHSEQVAAFACALADALGLSRETQRILRVAGLLHDVGKIGVPDRILRKPGRLEPEEWEAMWRHVALSTTLVQAVVPDLDVLVAVAHHHERWDGEGYPRGLKGTQVPLLGRIMIVADAVSAMAMDRPYRKGLTHEMIVAELRKGAGTQFDPALVEPFIAAFSLARSDASGGPQAA